MEERKEFRKCVILVLLEADAETVRKAGGLLAVNACKDKKKEEAGLNRERFQTAMQILQNLR
jgi:hypothetical protein